MAAARYRFRADHADLTLHGLGWRAQFVDGRFETDDQRAALGVARQADANPDWGIRLVRGFNKPEDGE